MHQLARVGHRRFHADRGRPGIAEPIEEGLGPRRAAGGIDHQVRDQRRHQAGRSSRHPNAGHAMPLGHRLDDVVAVQEFHVVQALNTLPYMHFQKRSGREVEPQCFRVTELP